MPEGYTFGFEESFYNSVAYRFHQRSDGWKSYYILNEKKKRIAATMSFHLEKGIAKSPFRSPFGSIEGVNDLPENLLFDFFQYVERDLIQQAASTIVIKNYPVLYNEQLASLTHTFLINLGYSIANAEVDSVIVVSPVSTDDVFHRSERRRRDKSLQEGCVFRCIETKHLEQVYNFIHQCREAKGYALSLSLHDLLKIAETFPDRYLPFGVYKNEQLIAAAITIRVKENILYDFYHDHAATYDHLSPVTLLVDGIYDFCFQNKITLLDLGTSALEGKPNFGLLNFKKKLGAVSTSKFTFEKRL